MKYKTLLLIPFMIAATGLTCCNNLNEKCIFVEEFDRWQEYQSGNRVITDYSNIDKIDVYWNNGNVNLIKESLSVLIVQESNCSHDEAEIPLQSFIYEDEDGKNVLAIHYLQPGQYLKTEIYKDLEIRVPDTFEVGAFSVRTITGNLTSTIDYVDGYFTSESGNANVSDDDVHYFFADSRHGEVNVKAKTMHHCFTYNFYGKTSLEVETFDIYETRCETGESTLKILETAIDLSFKLKFSITTGELNINKEYKEISENQYFFGDEESENIGYAEVNVNAGIFNLY